MARIRNIKPGYFTNDLLAEVHPLGRILFAGLWCHADRAGRLQDRPRKIKVEVLPFDECDVDALLGDLAARGFIERYEVNGVRYIQVATFSLHQNPNIKEVPSVIPAPNGELSTVSPEISTSSPETIQNVPAQYEHGAGTVPALHLTTSDPVSDPGTDQVQKQALDQEGVRGEPRGVAVAPRQSASGRQVRSAPPAKNPAPAPKVNPWWDALVAGIGVTPTTSAERSKYGKVVGELRAAKATPEEILRRCDNYRLHWPNVELTPTALLEHWSRMEHPPPERAAPDRTPGRQSTQVSDDSLAFLRSRRSPP